MISLPNNLVMKPMTLRVGHGDTGDLTAGHSAPVTCVANLNKSFANTSE